MTVGEMRKALKKYPASAKIAYLAHDHSGEIEGDSLCWGGPIEGVDNAPDGVLERGYSVVIK